MLPNAKGSIARTKEYLEFVRGQPGLLLIDYDQKGMPDTVRAKLDTGGGVWEALKGAAPELARAARSERASTSAGLSDTTTGTTFPGSGGLHIYVQVKDSADIPRALETLHQRFSARRVRLALDRQGWADS